MAGIVMCGFEGNQPSDQPLSSASVLTRVEVMGMLLKKQMNMKDIFGDKYRNSY